MRILLLFQTVAGLGTVAFPTSTTVPAAQDAFARGVLLLHLFEYPAAAAAFRDAQRLDEGLALAYWGEAMTHNHPVWNEQDREAARAVLARAPEARTEGERGYLHAARLLFGAGAKLSAIPCMRWPWSAWSRPTRRMTRRGCFTRWRCWG